MDCGTPGSAPSASKGPIHCVPVFSHREFTCNDGTSRKLLSRVYFKNIQAPQRHWSRVSDWWPLLVAALSLVALSVLVRPISHDEGQYVAAIEFARHGLPYRDFAYLQTPLQPIVLSPLGVLPAGWLLVGVRIANALFGLLTIALLILALKGRATHRSTMIALTALICSEPFLLATSNARNDALPLALIAMTILALFRGLLGQRRPEYFGAAGLLLGLAGSTKLNSAVLIAPLALFLLLRVRQFGLSSVAACFAGVIVGLLPSVVFAAIAPPQFKFDVFTYSLVAPRQWWTAVGHENWLEPPFRIVRLLSLAGHGCALVGIGAAVLDRRRSDDRLLLDLMILGGLVAAYLPEPAYAQYLGPLLPPVAARFAIAIDGLPWRLQKPLVALTFAFSMAGLVQTGKAAARTVLRGSSLAEGVVLGHRAATAAAGGSIVTLSPQFVAGSDTKLDPGFVTGPFLFRTFGQLGDDAMRFGYSPNWQMIDSALDERRPRVILTGGESKPRPPLFPSGLDAPLIAWAIAHQYKRMPQPGGRTLWQRPN
jgi:4-amino-4-deoxy-L-arabinose transferase-like glycosyltransferase